jgi:hypothetical protein
MGDADSLKAKVPCWAEEEVTSGLSALQISVRAPTYPPK